MKIKAIKKISISDEVSHQIQELILNDYFKPGQKLPSERELCEEFDVSRTSVREALRGLLSYGLLEKKSDGTYVRESMNDIVKKPMRMLLTHNKITISEVFEARQILETQNVKLATKKATEDDLEQMRKCIEKMEDSKSSLKEIMDSSVNFHSILANATKNKVLIDVYQVIYSILDEISKEDEAVANIGNSVSSHRDIYEAIKSRDEITAEAVMLKHISNVYKTYKDK